MWELLTLSPVIQKVWIAYASIESMYLLCYFGAIIQTYIEYIIYYEFIAKLCSITVTLMFTCDLRSDVMWREVTIGM